MTVPGALLWTLVAVFAPPSSAEKSPGFIPLLIQTDPGTDTFPKKYTCDGEGGSPPLIWGKKLPQGTKSMVVFLEEAVGKKTVTHWVIYGMNGVPGLVPDLTSHDFILLNGPGYVFSARQGLNDHKKTAYQAPCPKPGTKAAYSFRVFAVDLDLTGADEPKSQVTRPELEALIAGHIVGKGAYELPYSR